MLRAAPLNKLAKSTHGKSILANGPSFLNKCTDNERSSSRGMRGVVCSSSMDNMANAGAGMSMAKSNGALEDKYWNWKGYSEFHICMYVYVCVCVCIVVVPMYVCVCVCVCVCMYRGCTYVCMCMCMCVCVCIVVVPMYVCVCVCVFVHMYRGCTCVCMNECVCVFVYVSWLYICMYV
jgi:hypothetical protein